MAEYTNNRANPQLVAALEGYRQRQEAWKNDPRRREREQNADRLRMLGAAAPAVGSGLGMAAGGVIGGLATGGAGIMPGIAAGGALGGGLGTAGGAIMGMGAEATEKPNRDREAELQASNMAATQLMQLLASR